MNKEVLIQILKQGIKINKQDNQDIEAMRYYGVNTSNWEHKGPFYQKNVRIEFNKRLANRTLENVIEVDCNSFYPRILLNLDIDSKLKEFVQFLLDLRNEYKGIDTEKELLAKLTVNKLIGILGSELSIYQDVYAPTIHAQVYQKARDIIDQIVEFININNPDPLQQIHVASYTDAVFFIDTQGDLTQKQYNRISYEDCQVFAILPHINYKCTYFNNRQRHS